VRDQTERTLADPRTHSTRNGSFFVRFAQSGKYRRGGADYSLIARMMRTSMISDLLRREGWWACLDLNQGPSGYEPVALTTELQALRTDSNAFDFSRLRRAPSRVVRCRVDDELRGLVP
jgi:hypothetical protein